MAQWNYRYAGLQIASQLPIPEWTIFACDETADKPDVLFTLQPPAAIPAREPFVRPNECRFSIPETGEYCVRRGCEIIVTPAPGAGAAELRLFLLGSAWAALCYQRGLLALHVSVVQVGEQAAAFCGPSGAGKSSLAAALTVRGYPLRGDDLCCIEFISGEARVYPSAPRLKLWRQALNNLGWSADDLERDHFRQDKFHLSSHASSSEAHVSRLTSLPLGAIYLLSWGELGLARLTGLEALRRLVASATYRAQLIEPLGLTGAYWESCARLARSAPLWELKRPCDWDSMNATLAYLIESWHEGFYGL